MYINAFSSISMYEGEHEPMDVDLEDISQQTSSASADKQPVRLDSCSRV